MQLGNFHKQIETNAPEPIVCCTFHHGYYKCNSHSSNDCMNIPHNMIFGTLIVKQQR